MQRQEEALGIIITVFDITLSSALQDLVPDATPSLAVGSNLATHNPNSSPLN